MKDKNRKQFEAFLFRLFLLASPKSGNARIFSQHGVTMARKLGVKLK